MKKEDFKLELNEDLLSIRAEHKQEKEETNDRYTKREFNFASFVRSFRLPEEVDAEHIGATYRDGILNIEIPKLENKVKEKVREISIS
jgi:HSP20 family protein